MGTGTREQRVLFVGLIVLLLARQPPPISPLGLYINSNKHRQIGQPHVAQLQAAVIDQHQA